MGFISVACDAGSSNSPQNIRERSRVSLQPSGQNACSRLSCWDGVTSIYFIFHYEWMLTIHFTS